MMTDADGIDHPPETNPLYRDIYERDHGITHCKLCDEVDEVDELGYCPECEIRIVRKMINELSKPTMVFRFAEADNRTNTGAELRRKNAAREYIKIMASL